MTQMVCESELVMTGEMENSPALSEVQSQISPIVLIDLGISGMDGWDGYRQVFDLVNIKEL